MADYQGKKVVIIGLGLTGLSCVDFFVARGVTPRVMDTRVSPSGLDKLADNIERHLGSLNEEWLLDADLIVASPGIALATPALSAAAEAGVEIVGDIELFCRETQTPIVAITGSNGKSTVTMLVGEMAKSRRMACRRRRQYRSARTEHVGSRIRSLCARTLQLPAGNDRKSASRCGHHSERD
jgi:UDP-N-acetylmuramoylalanine--D-glutamate ligase